MIEGSRPLRSGFKAKYGALVGVQDRIARRYCKDTTREIAVLDSILLVLNTPKNYSHPCICTRGNAQCL
jgi:hypothetical protein